MSKEPSASCLVRLLPEAFQPPFNPSSGPVNTKSGYPKATLTVVSLAHRHLEPMFIALTTILKSFLCLNPYNFTHPSSNGPIAN